VLDALRGACALVVVLHHVHTLFPATSARLAHGSELAGPLAAFASRRSTEAVLLFFVLSGFSIRLSVERSGLRDAASVGEYLRRRARRILPPYLLALALSALVAYTVAPVPAAAVSLSTLAGNLLFLQTAMGVPGQCAARRLRELARCRRIDQPGDRRVRRARVACSARLGHAPTRRYRCWLVTRRR
jgi:peptidoglycan/LPS O-acetylase OafA/YrhL